MATIHARVIYQHKFKYHTLFSASFYKNIGEDQKVEEIELLNNLNINPKLTVSDNKNIDVKSQLEHQIQFQETKRSGWIYDKINSMKIEFYKTGYFNGSSYFKTFLRSNAILHKEKNDKYCFLWSFLASSHPCEISHPSKVKSYRQ